MRFYYIITYLNNNSNPLNIWKLLRNLLTYTIKYVIIYTKRNGGFVMPNINEVIKRPEYKFLYEDKHLKNKIMFLTFGGSISYGTNLPTSDIDIRGVALNSPEELIGIKSYEQYTDSNTDTTIYTFNKLVGLLMNCNPNTIEMLGCKPEHYAMLSESGKMLIDNVGLFLSKRAFYSFSGYANSQLRRLQNAVARDRVSQGMKEDHIKNSIIVAMNSFKDKYSNFDGNKMIISTIDSSNSELEKELVVDINLSKYPLREINAMLSEMSAIVRDYDKLNHRNNKKDELHLNKHAMHLLRLYIMCYDILMNHQVITYREKEHDLLMSVRNGEFMNSDCTFSQDFFDIVDEYENKIKKAYELSTLPDEPDYDKINEFVMKINKQAIEENS